MNKDLLEWACWTAKEIDVYGKRYCIGHIAMPNSKPGSPINKCLHCTQWIGNRRTVERGNLVLHQDGKRMDKD